MAILCCGVWYVMISVGWYVNSSLVVVERDGLRHGKLYQPHQRARHCQMRADGSKCTLRVFGPARVCTALGTKTKLRHKTDARHSAARSGCIVRIFSNNTQNMD